MNSRERIGAALRREKVDYVPCSVKFNPLKPEQRMGRHWNFPWAPDTPVDEQVAYQVEVLGLDPVVNVGLHVCGPVPDVSSDVRLEGDVLHKQFTTPAGKLHASVRYNDLWPHGRDIPLFSDFNVGHYVEPWLQTEADLECFKYVWHPADADTVMERSRAGVEGARRLAARYDLAASAHIGMGLTGGQHLFGVSELCIMSIERPELVDAWLEYEHQINLRAIALAGELGVDIVQRNGFYETADFYGPDTLERFLGARLRRETEAVHAAGALICYTANTGVMPILDYLAALPLDCLFGIDIAFKGVDPAALRDTLTPAKSLWIGPSSVYHLWKGPDVTRQAVRDVFEVFGRTGLILSPCVSAHSIMPWESTLAMIEEWKRLR